MSSTTVQEIEKAIRALTPEELEELYSRLDDYTHPIDVRLKFGLASGRFDVEIKRALSDEQQGRVRPL